MIQPRPQVARSPPLPQVPEASMPNTKRNRQHEGEKGGDPAISYNNAETAERLADEIENRNPRDTRNRGPCVHCNATGGAAVQQPGLDPTESCIDSAGVSGPAVAAAAVSQLVDPEMCQPDSCLQVGLAGAKTSIAACTDCEQPSSCERSAHQTGWFIQSSKVGVPVSQPAFMTAGQAALPSACSRACLCTCGGAVLFLKVSCLHTP